MIQVAEEAVSQEDDLDTQLLLASSSYTEF